MQRRGVDCSNIWVNAQKRVCSRWQIEESTLTGNTARQEWWWWDIKAEYENLIETHNDYYCVAYMDSALILIACQTVCNVNSESLFSILWWHQKSLTLAEKANNLKKNITSAQIHVGDFFVYCNLFQTTSVNLKKNKKNPKISHGLRISCPWK